MLMRIVFGMVLMRFIMALRIGTVPSTTLLFVIVVRFVGLIVCHCFVVMFFCSYVASFGAREQRSEASFGACIDLYA